MLFNKNQSILVTGGAGFIGSELIQRLNYNGITNITILENDSFPTKWKNLVNLQYNEITTNLLSIKSNKKFDYVIHLGAHSNTTLEPNIPNWNNNIELLKDLIWNLKYKKFIFASSASIYGNSKTFDEDSLLNERPNSFYAFSKKQCDDYIRQINHKNIFSLRFFNVFGKNESHKGNMASPIYKWLNQDISEDNKIKLFKGINSARDFIWVNDVCRIIETILYDRYTINGGIYNVGSGIPEKWEEVAKTILRVRGLPEHLIEYIPMPENLKNGYQLYTKADLIKTQRSFSFAATNFETAVKCVYNQLKS